MNKIIKKIPITLFLLSAILLGSSTYCQENKESDNTNKILNHLEEDLPLGKIKITQEQRLDKLLRKHISYNDSLGIQGWKILVYRGRELKMAREAGALFDTTFPDLELDYLVDYQAPDFKTLVGAFRTREEAYRIHQQIKSEFEFSYLVHASIKPGEFK